MHFSNLETFVSNVGFPLVKTLLTILLVMRYRTTLIAFLDLHLLALLKLYWIMYVYYPMVSQLNLINLLILT